MISTSDSLVQWAATCGLLSLRVTPIFAFAPPFSLMRIPAIVRVLLGIGISAALVSSVPSITLLNDLTAGGLVFAAVQELFIGSVFVMTFQLSFAALYLAGRTIDIQAGFGLAALIDPNTQAQTPLVGTIYAYAAGVVFFSLNGHFDLLRILAATLEAIPMGQAVAPVSIARLTSFVSVVFLTGFGVAGGAVLALFLTDVAIALLSRTAPQMNVLVLGFQVKVLLLLAVLPITLGVAGALLARMATITLEALPTLLS